MMTSCVCPCGISANGSALLAITPSRIVPPRCSLTGSAVPARSRHVVAVLYAGRRSTLFPPLYWVLHWRGVDYGTLQGVGIGPEAPIRGGITWQRPRKIFHLWGGLTNRRIK